MSITAHRVEKIIYKKKSTFNVFHDDSLVNFLMFESNIKDRLDGDSCGVFNIDLEVLERALVKIPDLQEETIKELKDDIEWSKAQGNSYVEYYCF